MSAYEDALAAHQAASRAWDQLIHDATITLLRSDDTTPVDRARLLGEDDARRNHPEAFAAVWETKHVVDVSWLQQQREDEEQRALAQGVYADRMSAVVARGLGIEGDE